MLALEQRAADWFKDNLPGTRVSHGTGSNIMFAHIGQSNIRSMLEGTFGALILISLVLALSLRSAWYGALAMLPNLLPALVGFGIWGLLVGQIGLGLSVVFGMTLGIVVDYTVHFLSKFLRATREHNYATEEGIRYAFGTVGVALVVTTLILCANFAVLTLSDFALNSEMGLMTAATIVIALLVDFLFVPPLLIFLLRRRATAIGGTQMAQQPGTQQPETQQAAEQKPVTPTVTVRPGDITSHPTTHQASINQASINKEGYITCE
jgi:predicted RND superfamily exporter protein